MDASTAEQIVVYHYKNDLKYEVPLTECTKTDQNLSYLKSLFEFFDRHKYGLYHIICHVLS